MGVDILHFNMTAGTVGMQRNLNLIPGLIALGLAHRNSDPSASQSLGGPAVWQSHKGLESWESELQGHSDSKAL